MPQLIVVAGVNGSGKSTLTQKKRFNNLRVIDPDAIAKKIYNRANASARVEGGRAAIKRRRSYLNENKSFVLETTLAGHSTYRFMQDALVKGYHVELHYVYLTGADQSTDRVSHRVSKGGHDIPEADIIRRFQRSRDRFEDTALISDKTVVYDNTSHEPALEHIPVLVADSKDFQIDESAPDWLFQSVERIRSRALSGAAARIWGQNLCVISSPTAPGAG